MATSLNINTILSQVKQLERDDQLMLLQQLASFIKEKEMTKASSARLTTLSGLGSGTWKSTDEIDKYLDEERQW